MPKVFVPVVGQDDNLGDSVLRRGLLRALRNSGAEMHVYVGTNSSDYCSALGLHPSDVLYSEWDKWFRALRQAAWRERHTSVALNAGESRVQKNHSYIGLRYLLAIALVRLRRGAAIQTGVGLRLPIANGPQLARFALRLASLVTWRDPESMAAMRVGTVAPDWGFYAQEVQPSVPGEARPYLAISLRGDRPAPSDDWIAAVHGLAEQEGLIPLLVVQVKRDADRAEELRERLGPAAQVDLWATGTHEDREREVRDIYRHSRAVVSDRLHVLILAMTEGAAPIGFTPGAVEKVQRTLRPVGYDTSCFSVVGADPADIVPRLRALIAPVEKVLSDAQSAHDRLEKLGNEAGALITAHPGSPSTRD